MQVNGHLKFLPAGAQYRGPLRLARPQATYSAFLWSLGQADPVRRPLPLTESLLILQFTAGWTAAAAPRPLEDIAVVEQVSFVMKGGTPR
jgi:hypothetical protein